MPARPSAARLGAPLVGQAQDLYALPPSANGANRGERAGEMKCRVAIFGGHRLPSGLWGGLLVTGTNPAGPGLGQFVGRNSSNLRADDEIPHLGPPRRK